MTRRSLIMSAVAFALRKEKLGEATALIQAQVDSGAVRAASLHVCQGKDVFDRAFGEAKTPGAAFLLASISKPMTASAVMLLSDRKQLTLDDPVRKFIPEFRGGEKDKILIRHLLTHTSGLPDMLPENEALRKRHAPLKDFVSATCATPLLIRSNWLGRMWLPSTRPTSSSRRASAKSFKRATASRSRAPTSRC